MSPSVPARHLRVPLLVCAVLLLLSPALVFASEAPDYAQGEEGFVQVIDSEEVTKWTESKRGRVRSKNIEVKITVHNQLDRAIKDLRFSFGHNAVADGPMSYLELQSPTQVAPGEKKVIQINRSVAHDTKVFEFSVFLTHYRVERPNAAVLFKLADSDGLVDQAVAAELASVEEMVEAGDRLAFLRAVEAEVKKGPAPKGDEPALLPLVAARALAARGGEEAIPVLLDVLAKPSKEYENSLFKLRFYRDEYPTHPLVKLLGNKEDAVGFLAGTLATIPAKTAVPRLVVISYQDQGPRRAAARLALTTGWRWFTTRVAALREAGEGAGPAIDALCQGDDVLAVRMLMGLAATGSDGGKAKGCIAALPESLAVTGLIDSLGDKLGTAEPLAVELLVARGAAARTAMLRAAAELNPPADADVAALAKLLLEDAKQARQAAVVRVLKRADEALGKLRGADDVAARAELLDEALQNLTVGETVVDGEAQRAQLAAAYARYAEKALFHHYDGRLAGAVKRIEALLTPKPADATADEDLLALAQIVAAGRAQADQWLGRLEPLLVAPASRTTLAGAYVGLANNASSTSDKERLANAALALDPQNAVAKQVLADVASSRRAPVIFLLGFLTVVGGLGFVIAISGKSGYARGNCVSCGKYSALNDVTFRRNIGMLVMRQYAEKGGPMCKSCIHATFWGYSAINLTVGWWGLISALLTPFLQLGNMFHYTRSLLLPSKVSNELSDFSAPPQQRLPASEFDAMLAANHEKMQRLLEMGVAHDEIAAGLEAETGLPRRRVLEYLKQIEAEQSKDVA
jgi:hypothetical protein